MGSRVWPGLCHICAALKSIIGFLSCLFVPEVSARTCKPLVSLNLRDNDGRSRNFGKIDSITIASTCEPLLSFGIQDYMM